MTWLDEIEGPTDSELWAIEAISDLLAAEVALVSAEAELFTRPGKTTAAAYLRSLLDVVDLHDFAGHDQLLVQPTRSRTGRRCTPAQAQGAAR